jgi:hypothetical protein
VRLVGTHAEDAQDVFGDRICGARVVSLRLSPQQITQPQQRPARHGQRKLGIFRREASCGDGGSDVATRAWGQSGDPRLFVEHDTYAGTGAVASPHMVHFNHGPLRRQ